MIRKYIYQNQEYLSSYSVRQAIWKNEGKAFSAEPEESKTEFWAALGVAYIEEPDPEPTEEEKAAAKLEEAKRTRAAQVAAIIVEVDGMSFNGDEMSQSRMSRAILSADTAGLDSTVWVLADDTVATVTKDQLKQALAKSMLEMGSLWTVPYEDETSEDVSEPALAKVGV